MTWLVPAAGLIAAGIVLAIVPRRLIARRQDRFAAEILSGGQVARAFRLLTPAERFIGRYRRVPGVLGLLSGRLVFESWLELPTAIPLAQVKRLVSGKVLSTGRRLFRDEALTIILSDGTIHEFQMPRASVAHWRRALSEWAAAQKTALAAAGTPGTR